jgi:hypothetical protein
VDMVFLLALLEVGVITLSMVSNSWIRLLPSPSTVRIIKRRQPRSKVLRDLGIRVKAFGTETGTIKGVTYDGITLSSISKYAHPLNLLYSYLLIAILQVWCTH